MSTTVLTERMQTKSVTISGGSSLEISLETGKLAKQAHGSAIVRMGNTMLLATVVSNYEAKEGQAFFPLSVDYQEKYASAGKIPGGFFKREARLSEYEILISRLVDRALRPLFPDGYMNETQVLISMISADKDVMPDSLAALAASTALMLSDIPFAGPVSECRVARIDGQLVVNPGKEALANADFDIIMAASLDNVVMVEGEMAECSEDELITAIQFGHEAIKAQCQAQLDLVAQVGAKEKREVAPAPEDLELKATIDTFARARYEEVARAGHADKHLRKELFTAIKNDFIATLGEEADDLTIKLAKGYLSKLEKEVIRTVMIHEKKRLDGRKMDEIRPLDMEIDFLPSAHGSALFTRGETQSLTTLTLGTKLDEQMIDSATYKGTSKFMLHYNFPPFSTGEAKPMRGTSRREVGHGNLAHRSVKRVLPEGEANPYTLRVVSDILESNGSSSMATVCAASLALMDAGVQTSNHVSGIAMGLVSDDSGNYSVLSDILGDEDHLGDMDFKVTGTRNGICACQMDIKLEGLSYEIMKSALEQARAGRLHILDAMYDTIDTPRAELKPHVPRMEKVIIAKDFIGAIIGPGGKVIQEKQAETDTVITIEEIDGKGQVVVSGDNAESIQSVLSWIAGITSVPEIGDEYEAKVKSIMPYGAFVEFLPGKEGLLHISEISHSRLESMDGVFEEGEVVKVKLLDVDKRSGKFKLSRKVLMPKPE